MYEKWFYDHTITHPKFLILGAGSNLFSPQDVARDLVSKIKTPDSIFHDLDQENRNIPQTKTQIKNTPYSHHIIKISLPCKYTMEQIIDIVTDCPATFILIGALFARLAKSRNLSVISIILPPLDFRLEKPFLATYCEYDQITFMISNLYKKCHKHIGVFQGNDFYYYDIPLELKTKWQWKRLLQHVTLYRKMRKVRLCDDIIRIIIRYGYNI